MRRASEAFDPDEFWKVEVEIYHHFSFYPELEYQLMKI